ncbi:MAG: ABC transporter ATP-binding protein [Planctomycetaceae bacterium]|nr:ABC transporter ATP-binding protein [Planctomycetaceae bacterium]
MIRRIFSSRARYRQTLEDLSPRREAASAAKDKTRGVVVLVREFWRLARPERPWIAVALVTVTVSTSLGLIPPFLTKFIIDNVLGDASRPSWWPTDWTWPTTREHLLQGALAIMVAVSAVKTVVHVWGRWIATRTVKRLQIRVRHQLFDHAARLPLHRVQELKSGGAASLLREDAGSVGELVFGLLYNPWRAIVQLLGSLAILAFIDARLLLGGLALLPMVFFSHRAWISRIRPLFRAVRKSRQTVDGQATEVFGGMRVVRAFGQQRAEGTRFVRGSNLMIRLEILAWWWARGVEVLWELLIPIASAGMLWYGGQQVLSGELSLGDVVMFLVYLLMLLEPLAVLAESATALQNSLAGLDRVLDLLAEPKEMEAEGHVMRSVDRHQVRGRIDFENVSFHYPASDRPVLSDINLSVTAGTTIALVGPSGAGKTTLCNLVARFYDPTSGVVRLDGIDLRELEVESYRQLIGLVEQDVFLFDGTIGDNIRYGQRDATWDELREAARLARVDEFVDQLEKGFDTVIGERGVKLSGGQRQRIAIARAILCKPKILILDEATSNLDTESEQFIQEALAGLMTQRTCFVIAHRLSTIRNASTIVVLEDGRIRELGTHAELFARDSRYREMVIRQIGSNEHLPADSV